MSEIRKIGDDVTVGIDYGADGTVGFAVVLYDADTGHSRVVATECVRVPMVELNGDMVQMTAEQVADAIEIQVRDQYGRQVGSDGNR